jgi:phage FluMu gp28-like protein
MNWLQENAWIRPRSINWWIAPIYAQSKMVYRRLVQANRDNNSIKSKSDSELRVELISDGVMEFRSADNPDSLRGEGVSRVVIDEAARVKRDAWEDVMRPAISDTGGRVMFISTPKGRNWFYELWTRGQDKQAWPEYESWSFPSSDNPRIPASDIEQARLTLPDTVFRQEYLAEFLEDSAGVFRNINRCIGSHRESAAPGHNYYAGLDLAKYVDFTVLTILNENGHQVYFNRLNKLDWPYQKQLITEIVKQYGASLCMDSTGVGDPIYDDLAKAGLRVMGYKFTQESKKKLIESLMISFEQERIRILDEPVQTNELQIFEYTINPSGTVSYSAPEGYHDDCVMALALANWARSNTIQRHFYVI